MKIIGEQELIARLDFMRPLKPAEPEPEGSWPIPFAYGENVEGTRISVPKARQIIAELRAEVAEYEKRELRRAFDAEKERNASLEKGYSEMAERWMKACAEAAALKVRLRRRSKR